MLSITDRDRGTPARSTDATVTLAIDTRDCIGCDVCVAHCAKGVLKMIDGKALVDLRQINQCDLDGECVEVCPTDVVSLVIQAEGTGGPSTTVESVEDAVGAR